MLIVEGHKIVNYSEHMTDDELFDFCQANKELQIERDAQHNIIIMAPVGGESGYFESEFIIDVGNWIRKTKNGVSFSSSTGFILPNGAMRSPDASWVSPERWQELSDEQKKKFLPIVSDFVVEVRSPSDKLDRMKDKMQEWIDNGVRLAWLVDTEGQQSFIYRANGSIEIVPGFDQVLDGEDVMEGFSFDLSQLRLS